MNKLKGLLVVFLVSVFHCAANAQSIGTGEDGRPVYRVNIGSGSTIDIRNSALNALSGLPSSGSIWIQYTDNKFEKAGLVGNNWTVSGAIRDSTAPWWKFWAQGNCDTINVDGITTSITFWVNTIWVGTVSGTVYDISSYAVTLDLGGGGSGGSAGSCSFPE